MCVAAHGRPPHKKNVLTDQLQLATAVYRGTVLKPCQNSSRLVHRPRQQRRRTASSSRSATERVRPSEARDSHVDQNPPRGEKGTKDNMAKAVDIAGLV